MPIEKVLTAILFVLSEGCSWRAIHQPDANWNSVYQYYRRWCKEGLWEKLCPGNDADVSHVTAVLQELPAKMVVADKGYDSDALRIWLYERDTTPCIPSRSNRNDPLPYRRQSYRKRYLVENFFAHIKTFRRVATRYDKLAEAFLGWVCLAVLVKFGI